MLSATSMREYQCICIREVVEDDLPFQDRVFVGLEAFADFTNVAYHLTPYKEVGAQKKKLKKKTNLFLIDMRIYMQKSRRS